MYATTPVIKLAAPDSELERAASSAPGFEIIHVEREAVQPARLDHDAFWTAAQVIKRFNVSSMTLHRWLSDPALGFPRPVVIQKRRYFRIGLMLAFEARLAEQAK